MLKKENKIFVVVCPDVQQRKQMIAKLAVKLGFAMIPSDAMKLIRQNIHAYDLSTAYFVMCSEYNFRGASITNQRLYEMAARGICIIVGVRSLPREYELISQAFYPENCNQLFALISRFFHSSTKNLIQSLYSRKSPNRAFYR